MITHPDVAISKARADYDMIDLADSLNGIRRSVDGAARLLRHMAHSPTLATEAELALLAAVLEGAFDGLTDLAQTATDALTARQKSKAAGGVA